MAKRHHFIINLYAAMNKSQNPAAKPLHEGKERLEESQKKTVDGIWAAVILLGLLVLVVIMHWLRTN